MNHWDQRFLDMAALVASWSKDPTSQVGAVIVNPHKRHRVVSLGFNGFPSGIDDTPDLLHDREEKLARMIHAEENALLFAGGDVEGCTIYVMPFMPCSTCAAKLIQAGITRIVSIDVDSAANRRWAQSFQISKQMLREAGVQVCLGVRG